MTAFFSIEDFIGVDTDPDGHYLKQRASRELRMKRTIELARIERKKKMRIEYVVASKLDTPSVYEDILQRQGVEKYVVDPEGFVYFQEEDDALRFFELLDGETT